jgi:probable HAF family extracellular repeat protein
MRPHILRSVTLVLALWACASDETPTEPTADANLARAAVRTYTAVDLGTLLGGAFSVASGINSAGQVVGEFKTDVEAPSHAFLLDKGVC